MCCLSWSIPFPLNHGHVCGRDYHMKIKSSRVRAIPWVSKEMHIMCIYKNIHIIFISHTKLQLIIHFPCSNFQENKWSTQKGIQFTSFQGHFYRYALVSGASSTTSMDQKIVKMVAPLGWYPFSSTPYTPCILGIFGYNSFKRAPWGVKQLGALHPKGAPSVFPMTQVLNLYHIDSWLIWPATEVCRGGGRGFFIASSFHFLGIFLNMYLRRYVLGMYDIHT